MSALSGSCASIGPSIPRTRRPSRRSPGCPVLSVAVTESRTGPAHHAVESANGIFAAWSQTLTDSLTRHGVELEEAEALATLIVCSVEGSVGLCRVEGSTRALDQVETTLIRAITATLPGEN
ncbi:MAG: hypothetical protein Q7T17_17055 [Microbacterium sp.]|uniref:LmrA/YxaF family transcription factor n=1 Tax=Microbacterium sp. TaxID=51671 RepID=UPI0027162DE5|nr:hypothetical protein [Microbacterium sp.]MDO8384670.1 hypothetical protein [Microbacterium sp.]